MRGTKLLAWQIPVLWDGLKGNLDIPEGSSVPQKQDVLRRQTEDVLHAIAIDIRAGLLETVGVESRISLKNGRASMVLELPVETDVQRIADAIDAENLESWVDDELKVNVAICPWYSTKDVDQTVLCATKIVHVILGLHAVCEIKPLTFKERLISSIIDVMKAQNENKKK